MTDHDFDRVQQLFLEARRLAEHDRQAFLDEACEGQPELAREVRGLLAADTDESWEWSRKVAGSLEAMAQDERTAAVGSRLADFELGELLGAGGMGVVHRARQAVPSRDVALKIIQSSLAHGRYLRRFEREAELLARLQHPGIAQIFAAGVDREAEEARPWIAMELVDGPSLGAFVRDSQPSTEERVQLLIQIAEAVQHAHERGVLHRDLKPSNILIANTDSAPLPKLLDFGIARAVEDEAGDGVTLTGDVFGTLPYMSPEQALGASTAVDVRSDIYALGVIAYELLVGELPLDLRGLPLRDALRKLEHEEPTSLGAKDTRLRGDLDTIVGVAMAKEPERRYCSAADLAADLRRHLAHEPIRARAATAGYRVRKFVVRHRVLVGGVVATILVLLAGVVVATSLAMAEADARVETELALEDAEKVQRFYEVVFNQAKPGKLGREARIWDALDRATEGIDDLAEGRPRLDGVIRTALGRMLYSFGRMEEAIRELERARISLESGIEGDHSRKADCLSGLGEARAHFSGDPQGVALIEAAIAMRRRLGKSGASQKEGNVLVGLAYSQADAGDYEDAAAAAELAAGVFHELGKTYAEGAARYALGEIRFQQGRGDDAVAAWRQARDLVVQSGREDSPVEMTTRYRLASGLMAKGRLELAESDMRSAVTMAERLYGPEHNMVGSLLTGLGQCLTRSGEFDSAIETLRRAVAVLEAALAPAHATVAAGRVLLAEALLGAGELEPAEAEIDAAIVALGDLEDASSEQPARARLALARLRRLQGRAEDAIQVLDAMEGSIGDWPTIAGNACIERARIALAEDAREDALGHFETGVGLLRGDLEPEDERLRRLAGEWADLLERAGQRDRAQAVRADYGLRSA